MSSSISIDFFPDCISLAPSAIQYYNQQLHTWIECLPENSRDIHFLLMFPNKSITYLQHILSNNIELRSYISAVNALFLHSSPVIQDIPCREEIEKRWRSVDIRNTIHNHPSHTINLEQIIECRDRLSDGSIEKLLICMYTMIPPVHGDYYATQIVYHDMIPTEPDMIRFTDSEMTRGSLILGNLCIYNHTLPSKLLYQIKQSLHVFPRNYLFVDQTGKPFTRSSFQLWANSVLSHCFGTQITLPLLFDILLNIPVKYTWSV